MSRMLRAGSLRPQNRIFYIVMIMLISTRVCNRPRTGSSRPRYHRNRNRRIRRNPGTHRRNGIHRHNGIHRRTRGTRHRRIHGSHRTRTG
jgi:hypothetical protein